MFIFSSYHLYTTTIEIVFQFIFLLIVLGGFYVNILAYIRSLLCQLQINEYALFH